MSDIKKVLVIGATGSIGPAIVNALCSHPQGYVVSILTRPESIDKTRSMFPDPAIKIHTADYTSETVTPDAFESSFKGQDAVVSAVATFTTSQQRSIVDAAIATNTIKRFIPSEYGIDTAASDSLRDNVPAAYMKTDVISYLKTRESSLSWSAICVGAFFDWSFTIPGLMGWDLASKKATIFDGGDVPYEAANIGQIGAAVAAVLSSALSSGFEGGLDKGKPMVEITRNKYVYVNSFTTTQNEVLRLLEKHSKDTFQIQHAIAADLGRDGATRSLKSMPGFRPTVNSAYADGTVESIVAAIYGNGNLNNFSQTRGLWNEALGLKTENLEDTIKGVVAPWNAKE